MQVHSSKLPSLSMLVERGPRFLVRFRCVKSSWGWTQEAGGFQPCAVCGGSAGRWSRSSLVSTWSVPSTARSILYRFSLFEAGGRLSPRSARGLTRRSRPAGDAARSRPLHRAPPEIGELATATLTHWKRDGCCQTSTAVSGLYPALAYPRRRGLVSPTRLHRRSLHPGRPGTLSGTALRPRAIYAGNFPTANRDEEQLQQLEQARVGAQGAPEHIAPLLDFGTWIDARGEVPPYIVMPLDGGRTLREAMFEVVDHT